MMDTISIAFRKHYGPTESCESVALFSRRMGEELILQVCEYLEEVRLRQLAVREGRDPLQRLEPHAVMVDFIRWLTKDWDRVGDALCLGRYEGDGDNSKNGHVIFDLDSWHYTRTKNGETRSISPDYGMPETASRLGARI